jgi:outer membrane beta-barrel protein
MTARAPKKVLAIIVAAVAAALPAESRASKADAFENKIDPVSGQLYQKSHRFELTLPSANLSLRDAFFHKYFVGLKAGYHFNEVLSVNASFAGGITSPTGSTTLCPETAGSSCRPAGDAQLNQVPGKIKMMAGAELAFSPIYGKLNLVAESVLHLDLSLLAGVDLVRYQAALSTADAIAGVSPPDQSSIGGHLGIGMRIFLSNSVALRLELKDYLYRAVIGNDKSMQNQLFAEMGLSFFLPFGYKANP